MAPSGVLHRLTLFCLYNCVSSVVEQDTWVGWLLTFHFPFTSKSTTITGLTSFCIAHRTLSIKMQKWGSKPPWLSSTHCCKSGVFYHKVWTCSHFNIRTWWAVSQIRWEVQGFGKLTFLGALPSVKMKTETICPSFHFDFLREQILGQMGGLLDPQPPLGTAL